jgi:hypothetical protein
VRNVQLWTCSCGTRYRAVSEVDRINVPTTSMFVCQVCKHEVPLDGELLQASYELENGLWIAIGA